MWHGAARPPAAKEPSREGGRRPGRRVVYRARTVSASGDCRYDLRRWPARMTAIRATASEGVDVYFGNVGGTFAEAVLPRTGSWSAGGSIPSTCPTPATTSDSATTTRSSLAESGRKDSSFRPPSRHRAHREHPRRARITCRPPLAHAASPYQSRLRVIPRRDDRPPRRPKLRSATGRAERVTRDQIQATCTREVVASESVPTTRRHVLHDQRRSHGLQRVWALPVRQHTTSSVQSVDASCWAAGRPTVHP